MRFAFPGFLVELFNVKPLYKFFSDLRDAALRIGAISVELAEKFSMRTIAAISGALWRKKERVHVFILIIEEEGCVVQPAIFLNVLCIATTFHWADCVIIFDEVKIGDLPSGGKQFCSPAKDRFRVRMDREIVFGEDKRSKEGFFVDYDGASSAKALDYRDRMLFDFRNV